ncbi:MAG: SDR family NAD(P)-dependent oxidoreductase [Chloroflexi bacterium]|nr:SDR family NAD(P)-dependent oxidoreductase [Chloroflexota bacterium]
MFVGGHCPVPGLSLYAASKAAVRVASLSVANELVDKGVYVTVICPDLVDTPMLDLQLEYPAAALTFSGSSRPLTVRDMEKAFRQAMQDKPLEIALPSSRGFLSKIASLFPHQPVAEGPSPAKGPQLQKKLRQKEPGNEEENNDVND